MSSELSREILKLYFESHFVLRWPLWLPDRLMSLTITFSFYQSCFLVSLLFNVSPEFQVIALDFVLILHNNNDHHLDYDCLHFRHRKSMQLPGTTDCQITSVGEDRNQMLEHHEHPNSKYLLMLLRKTLGELVAIAAARAGSFKQYFVFACAVLMPQDTRSFLILKPHDLHSYLHRKMGMLHYWCYKIHLELGLIMVILCFIFSI